MSAVHELNGARTRIAELERERETERNAALAQAARLREALAKAVAVLREHAPGTPLNHSRYDALGIEVNAALSATADDGAWLAERLTEARTHTLEALRGLLVGSTALVCHIDTSGFRKTLAEHDARVRREALEEAAKLVDDAGYIDVVWDGEKNHEVPFGQRVRALATQEKADSKERR